MLKKIKFFLICVFVLSLFGAGLFGYHRYKALQRTRAIHQAFREKDAGRLLELFQSLKKKKDLQDEIYLKHCFYKASALEWTGKQEEASEFWELLSESSKKSTHLALAHYYLALLAKKEKEWGKAEFHFKKLLSVHVSASTSKDTSSIKKNNSFGEEGSYLLSEVLLLQGKREEATLFLKDMLKTESDSKWVSQAKRDLGAINMRALFSSKIDEKSFRYKILPGDSLSKIALQFNTTVDLIRQSNQLASSTIRPNNHIKITQAEFSLLISKSKNTLTLFRDGDFFKEYRVGTGRDNITPVGEFKVVSKQINPTWYRPDGGVVPFGSKENLLGTRWMSINYPGYGIHGTWDPETIGKQSSAGCVRLTNGDVEELFTILTINTKVSIVD